MTDRKKLARAQRHVPALKAFHIHLFAFAAVVMVLLVLNALTSAGWWVQWVFFGWGIGVAAHAIATFWKGPLFIDRWEKRRNRQMISI
jgi:hypothetical protein